MALMLKIQSLGYRTDLFLRGFEGEILERQAYTVVRTPNNPTFRWGNFLLFNTAPTRADLGPWLAAFALEYPNSRHVAIGWDDPQNAGDSSAFLEAGFRLDVSVVMLAKAVHAPPKINTACQIRVFEATDWQAWIDLECAADAALPEAEREGAGYREFITCKSAEYEQMGAAGHGDFWGAFLDGQLVASLGLYFWQGVGRFQRVSTHPDFRRRGLCSTLVHHVAKLGLERVETVVMVADPEYVAAGIYESVGFEPSEKQFGLEKIVR